MREALERAVADAARRIVAEASAEVKETVRSWLLAAAESELAGGRAPAAAPSRSSLTREIDDLAGAILGAPAGPDLRERDPASDRIEGRYVYGIVPDGCGAPEVEGVGGCAVEVVDLGNVRALVAPVSIDQIEIGAGSIDEADWVARGAAAHERVLTEAMATGPVLPFRFGTVFRNDDDLCSALGPHAAEFDAALRRVAGRAEWILKVRVRADAFRSWLERTTSRLTGRREAEGEGEGSRFMHRKRADRIVAEEAERASAELGDAIAESLCAHAVDVAPVTASGDVLRADAFLVPEEGGAGFLRAVDQLEAMLRDRSVSLETTGPLPPYHFVAVELRERAGA